MLGDRSGRGNPFHRLWQFVKRQTIGDVPEELAICQFDCPKGQCLQDEWEKCNRRIHKGAGELSPDSRLEKPHQLDPARSDKAEDIPDQTTEAAAERKRKIV
jgi:hypothetical protein